MANLITNKRIVLWCSIISLVAVVLPLFVISNYAVPQVDDFAYGEATHVLIENGCSAPRIVLQAIRTAQDRYQTWQGSFTAIFMMSLEPGIWSMRLYGPITTFLCLGMLLIGSFCFVYVLCTKVFKATIWETIPLFAIIMIMSLLWCPSPAESFYWYNGAIYYTFYYGLMLLLFSVVLLSFSSNGRPKWVYYIIGIVFALFIGGGNYITGILTLEILFFLVVISYILKKKNKALTISIFVVFLVTFIVNAIAPGNKVRAASTIQMGAVESIATSLKEGINFIVSHFYAPSIIILIMMIPLLWKISRSVDYSFKYPWLIPIISYCLFASELTPSYFGQSFMGPYRIQNIYYYSMWLFIVFNTMYWLGFIRVKFGDSVIMEKINEKRAVIWYSAFVVIFLIFAKYYGLLDTSTFLALKELKSGEAKVYYEESLSREEYILSSVEKEIEVEALSVYPRLLYFDEITEDPDDWRNNIFERYYDKELVVLKK